MIVVRFALLGLCSIGLLANPAQAQLSQPRVDSEKQTIESLLEQQDECWNRGDIEGFMATYWKSERLTFSGGGQTTRGWQATLDRYKKNYPREKMGTLHFDGLETTLLASDVAQVLGNWHLDLNGEKKDGNFTLIMKKIEGKWRIVHDHSSTLELEKGWLTVDQATEVGKAFLQLTQDAAPHVQMEGFVVRISEFDPEITGPTVYVNRKTGQVTTKKPDINEETTSDQTDGNQDGPLQVN